MLTASTLDASLPDQPFASWVESAMAPTPPRWKRVACTAPRPSAACVEARAERSNGLHFGVVVEMDPVSSNGASPKITSLYLEHEEQRQRFATTSAWAIAVAGLAPKPVPTPTR